MGFYFFSFTQIVNIENQRFKSDKKGFDGNIDLAFSVLKNQALIYNITCGSHIQYHWEKPTLLLVNNYTLIRATNQVQDLVNQTFQHLRFTFNSKARITPEVFAQWQYNPIQLLQSRILLGMGGRLKIIQNDSMRIFYGLNLMREHERLQTSPPEKNEDFRFSTHISGYFKIKDKYLISSTSYFQPNLAGFSDYRISHETSILLKFTQHLSYKLTYNIFNDTRPPIGVNKTFYTLTNGFSYAF